MATELGKAYVQIMPSARGISGSIQKTINPEATAAGKSAGSRIATSISDSMSRAGSTLTKAITVPAMAAATAVGGIVAAFGFKRLVGMDVAQAKLKGLGVEGKQLEIVMDNAREAVTGTTHTLADGADVAAGALAAGVKEGADLERYIKLVGDAATGANMPMGEMAQIFNRVQGTGKLTRTELDMIEHRLPGFSQTMAKHVGADSLEAFYDMVSAGKIGSDEFLDVMENFAGGMAEAYAGTWSGLKDNVLANIGIIGEALLEGLFEDGKKGLADFLQFLRESEGLKEWARNTGETLRNVFATIVEAIKNAINWWSGLSDGAKKAFLALGGIAVAIGPVLLIIGKLITAVMNVSKWFGLVKAAAGVLGGAIGAISAPVLIVIGVIASLIALFVALYKSNEGFRDLVHAVWEKIKETISTVIQTVSDFVMEIWGQLVAWWQENSETVFQAAHNVWNAISEVISTVMDIVLGVIERVWPVIQEIISTAWDTITSVISSAVDIILGIIEFWSSVFTGDWDGAWESIKGILNSALDIVKSVISGAFDAVWKVISEVMETVKGVISKSWENIKSKVSDVVDGIKEKVSNIFNSLKGVVSDAFDKVKTAVSDGIEKALDVVINIKDKFKEAGGNIVKSIADGIKGAIGEVKEAIGNVTSKIRNFLPFSPAKEGPLKDLDKLNFGGTISMGIDDGANEVQKAMNEMLGFKLSKPASRYASDNYEDVITKLDELIVAVREGKVLVMDDREVGRVIEPTITEMQERNKKIRGSFA